MTNTIPAKFKFYIDAFGMGGYSVEFTGNHLIYNKTYRNHPVSPEDAISIEPSEADWERFWQELDNLDIWKWKKTYSDPDRLDGTQWGLDFIVGGKSKKIWGCNSYPATYTTFIDALSTLMGGMHFR